MPRVAKFWHISVAANLENPTVILSREVAIYLFIQGRQLAKAGPGHLRKQVLT